MAKRTITLNGNKVVLDMNRPKVVDAIAALVEACAERQFPIGMILDHANGHEYILAKVNGMAKLINLDTGRCRNSRKVVYTQGPAKDSYVTDLPAERDKFIEANPCMVTHFLSRSPMAATSLLLTQTPGWDLSRQAFIPKSLKVLMITSSISRTY